MSDKRHTDGGLTDRIERVGKLVLLGIPPLYALGMIIQRIWLDHLRLDDFQFLQPKLVLVGFAYCVFLCAPLIPMAAAFYTYGWVSRRWGWAARRFLVPLLVAVVIGAATALAVSSPFWPFVVANRAAGVESPDLLVLIKTWGVYAHPLLLYPAVLFMLPAAILTAQRFGLAKRTRKWATHLLICLPMGLFVGIIPYAGGPFPQISRAVGGGSPSMVRITTKLTGDDVNVALDEPAPHSLTDVFLLGLLKIERTRSDVEVVIPYAILWHETDYAAYVSCPNAHHPEMVVAVPKSSITAISYLIGYSLFERGKYVDTVLWENKVGPASRPAAPPPQKSGRAPFP